MHVAFARHLQFGRDVVFGYGPWGFLCWGYYPQTHTVAVIAWTMLSLVFWLVGWRVARRMSDNLLFSWFWVMGFTSMASLPDGNDIDARLFAWVLLLLFLHFFEEERSFTPTQALLVVSLGLLSWVKFTGLIETMMIVTVIRGGQHSPPTAFSMDCAVAGSQSSVLLIAARQQLGLLWPFFRNSWQITSGYTEAMMLPGKNENQDIALFSRGGVAAVRFGWLCGVVTASGVRPSAFAWPGRIGVHGFQTRLRAG